MCYEFLKEKTVAQEPLSLGLIREVHRVLTSGTYDERRYIANDERPGEFKKHDYVTGIHEVGSSAADVADDLEALVEKMNAFENGDTMKAGAYFHARFEYIHPFADGNGRVGRTLLNYFLMTHDHPPLIVHDDDKTAYYAALLRYDEDEEIDALYGFLRGQTAKTWEKTLARTSGNDSAAGVRVARRDAFGVHDRGIFFRGFCIVDKNAKFRYCGSCYLFCTTESR